MPIEFSDHAKDRIKKGKISKNLVIKTVNEPDVKLSSFRGRKLCRKRFGSRILEVATKTEGVKITVITAYFLKETYEN